MGITKTNWEDEWDIVGKKSGLYDACVDCDMLKDFLSKSIERVRSETIDECIKALPDEATEGDGWEMLEGDGCCPGDDAAHGFNICRSDSIEALTKLKSNS